MTRILLDPEHLMTLSLQAERTAGDLGELQAWLHGVLGAFDWEIRRRGEVESAVEEARAQALRLGEQAGAWGRFLSAKAQEFARLDGALAQALAGVGVAGAMAGAAGAVHAATGGAVPHPGPAPKAGAGNALPDASAVPYGKGVPVRQTERWKPVDVPVTSTAADRQRLDAAGRVDLYNQVLSQFDVTQNPRYVRNGETTYCNIFVTDATRALGAEIPHWVQQDGTPASPGAQGAQELNANNTVNWLEQHGAAYGWRHATAEDAQRTANDGRPAVAVMAVHGGTGHVAVVRPGAYDPAEGPQIANAGQNNFESGTVAKGFGHTRVHYFVHE